MDLFEFAERAQEATAVSVLARRSDPQTSHDAADEIADKLNVRCRQFLSTIRVLGIATANEVAVHFAGSNIGLIGSIRRRASDLCAMGLIRIVGRRKCNVTGKSVHAYDVASPFSSVIISELERERIPEFEAAGYRVASIIPNHFGSESGILLMRRS
ncbi:hypothetical protein VN12_01950 [Pirellula sp. SH-Sr6A]|uniref:hypothetical protein n=1 Tax=Pirellula sp. SH-Sr6A TaxID=1632865 RepID=UPI00078D4541|nr:hypothetical protein [Pirellula sp. SH-Sr6A]AMV30849.1 hypothetical protein VN12_01950 [Pirellula sp. SH-Sr6A]